MFRVVRPTKLMPVTFIIAGSCCIQFRQKEWRHGSVLGQYTSPSTHYMLVDHQTVF